MDLEAGQGEIDRDRERQPGFLIRRLHQIHTALFVEESAGLDITPPQYGVLSVIAAQPGLDQSAIAEETGVDRATLASVVARLEAAGFVRRNISKTDRRQKLLNLTPRGRSILARMQPPVQRAQERVLEPLPQKEREQFLRLLNRLVDGGNDHGRAKLRLK